jgi:hypothetical protein
MQKTRGFEQFIERLRTVAAAKRWLAAHAARYATGNEIAELGSGLNIVTTQVASRRGMPPE